MNVRPIGKRVLLRVPEDPGETVSGGIVLLPGARRDKRRPAIVQAVPAGWKGDVVPGDTVYMKPYAGTEIVLNGERLVFCLESELEAVLE